MERLEREPEPTPAEQRRLAAELCLAIGHLHSFDVMIRELSPEHIHLSAGDHIKLTHCCAKRMGGRNGEMPPPPREHTLIGSPDFMAPEVILHKPYCEDADWWSYGVVLSELLAGYSPFYQEEPEIGELLKKVLHYPIAIPVPTSHANPQPALDLIGELLIREVDDGRLGGRRADGSASGYTAVLAHPYFDGLTREEVLSGLPTGEGELFRHAQGRSYVENHEGLQQEADMLTEEPLFVSMELASFGPPADLYVSGASRTARRALEDPMAQISAALSDFDALADGATSLNASTNTSTSLTSSRMSSSSGPADVS